MAFGVGIKITISAAFNDAKSLFSTKAALDRVKQTIDGLNDKRLSIEATFPEVIQANAQIENLATKLAELKTSRSKLTVNSKEWKAAGQEISRVKTALEEAHRRRTEIRIESPELQALEARLTRLGQLQDQLQSNDAKLSQVMQDRGEYRSRIVDAAALGYALYKPLQKAIELESAMINVAKVVDFAEPDGLKEFNADVMKLTRTLPLAANELATIAASGGQMGITEDKILEFTTLTAKMATAFDMSAQEAGGAIANLMNVYALDVSKTRELGDTINYVADGLATNAGAVTEIMSRVGGSAQIFGLTADQTTALSAAFSALGKSPQVAATSINTLLNRLSTAPQQGADFQESLEAIGLSAEDLKYAIENDAQGALTDFLGRLQEVDKGELMGHLTNLFGTGFADDIAILVSNVDKYETALNRANASEKVGSMETEFKRQSDSMANQLNIMGNAWGETLTGIGESIMPALGAITSIATTILQFGASIITGLGPVGTALGTIAAATIGLGVVIPVLGYAWTFAREGALRFKNALIVLRTFEYRERTAALLRVATEKIAAAVTLARTVATKALTIATNLFTASELRSRIAVIGSAIASKLHTAAQIGHTIATNASAIATRAWGAAMAIGRGIAAAFTSGLIVQRAVMIAGAIATGAMTAATWLFNTALLANPIGLVIAGIAALIGIGVLLYNNFAPFRELIDGVWEGFKRFASGIVAVVGPVVEWISDKFGLVADIIGAIGRAAAWIYEKIFGSGEEIKVAAPALEEYESDNEALNAAVSSLSEDDLRKMNTSAWAPPALEEYENDNKAVGAAMLSPDDLRKMNTNAWVPPALEEYEGDREETPAYFDRAAYQELTQMQPAYARAPSGSSMTFNINFDRPTIASMQDREAIALDVRRAVEEALRARAEQALNTGYEDYR
jgi:TP901 family phage tail tape measure protein